MRKRQKERGSKPIKTAQTFFCLDGDSAQPRLFHGGQFRADREPGDA